MRYRLLHGITPADDGDWIMYEQHERLLAEARREAFIRALHHAGYLPGSVSVAVGKHAEWLDGEGQR